ncbi:hypothetical protein [Ewingella americana]|uniref:Uncharacterized protein n=1 Tax=Ewingella americana TaxID=41202 RepID=A0A502GES7_9GAMM|nr:hypothetical protein [Ewingella americana]TPG60038.1 hypothetical protein EAH77_15840 [Ewingella americana]
MAAFILPPSIYNESLECRTLAKPIIGLGLDPGSNNFGWNIVVARDLADYVSMDSGNLLSVRSQYTEVTPAFLSVVAEEVMSLLLLSEATEIVIERYHPRGSQVLANVEYINNIIGAIVVSLSSLKHVTVRPCTASSWKPRVYNIDEGYEWSDWFPGAYNIHAGDAGTMLLSHLYQANVLPWYGKFWNGKELVSV